MKSLKFKTNINCENCVKSVIPFLNELDNVDFWTVDTVNPDKVLSVEIEDDNEKIVVDAVKKAGFEIEKIDG